MPKNKKISLWILPLSAAILLTGVLFKKMHWPISYELFITGVLTTTIFTIIEFIILRKITLNNILVALMAINWGLSAYMSTVPKQGAGPVYVIFMFITAVWVINYTITYYKNANRFSFISHLYKVLIIGLAGSTSIRLFVHFKYFPLSWIYIGLIIFILLTFEKQHQE